ncbi:acyltransferase family protein [Niabella ginsengisoli]|uniref:acyltransferase family protein n=1 Tax=Niabella ginsengisoli TaxID=522298 RepID=UPI00374DCF3F
MYFTGSSFFIPFSEATNFIVDPVIVIFYFPLLVALGAGSYLSKQQDKLCKFLGDISYPLYMIHYPILWMVLSYIEKEKPGMQQMSTIVIAGALFLILLSYGVVVFIDTPIRKFLKTKLIKETTSVKK